MLERPAHYLSDFGVREIRAALWDVPEAAPIVVDLGWLRLIDQRLIDELARIAGTARVTFEAAHWEVALEAANQLHATLADGATDVSDQRGVGS
jgi:hypothetical protein